MDKKLPKGRKRGAKGASSAGGSAASEENFWDCSVCTFRNNAEAFKCSMCDVRKGTSTRKPRINPDLVAAQHAQALTPPPASTSSALLAYDDDDDEEEEEEEEEAGGLNSSSSTNNSSTTAPKGAKKTKDKRLKQAKEPKESRKNAATNRARLKNVDRTSATYHSVTVNDITVVITEFKPKVKKEKAATKGPKSSNAPASGGDPKVTDNDSMTTKKEPNDSSNQENVPESTNGTK